VADSNRKFLFDHLPKTGGTAFRTVLEQIFGETNVSPWVSGRSELWAARRYADYPVISGHFHSPIPVNSSASGRTRITLLRHPIDRAVSEYYYYRNDVERVERNKLAILAKDYDLYEYAERLEKNRDAAISNFYSRRFASQLSRLLWSNKKVLALAKEALTRYAFVGIQEQFVDTVDVFCCRFGLPPLIELPRRNVTSSRVTVGDLDRRTREKLTDLNRLDLELYDYAANRFQSEKRKIIHQASGLAPVGAPVSQENPPAPENGGNVADTFGDRTIEFCHASVTGHASGSNVVRPGEETVISLVVDAHDDVSDLTVGIEISDELGEIVFGTNTHRLGLSRPVSRGQRYTISFSFPANMKHGRYSVGAALHTGATHADRCFHWCDRLTAFDVADDASSGFVGYCRLVPSIEWSAASRDLNADSCEAARAVSPQEIPRDRSSAARR
jgi:hypothetical protein